MPIPRDNVSGKGRRVLEGGVLGSPLPDVKFRDTLSGAGKLSITHEGMGLAGAGAGDARKKRAEIVKKVMKQRGVSLAEASKIVKSEGLYKK
jgi:hypothetical protein